jgi:sulfatase modifying factor 1
MFGSLSPCDLFWVLVSVGLLGCSAAPANMDGGASDAGRDGSGNSATMAASCQVSAPGTTNCGSNSESCCTSEQVPGGMYDRTYTYDDGGATGEADPASVSGFRLDKYLVTVGRFRQFVAATVAGWVPAAGSGKHTHLNGGLGLASSSDAGYEPGWNPGDTDWLATADDWSAKLSCYSLSPFATWTDTPGSNETLPINCIDWNEADAFCIWDGGFLPSEAEWEYAAAGGSQQRQYPWGSTDPGTGNLYAIWGCYYPPGSTACTGVTNIAPVGAAPMGAGRWGQLDLAGSLAEWILDWDAPYVDPCTDCAFLKDYSYRIVRGGRIGPDVTHLLAAFRDGDTPPSRNSFYGVRCARSPSP